MPKPVACGTTTLLKTYTEGLLNLSYVLIVFDLFFWALLVGSWAYPALLHVCQKEETFEKIVEKKSYLKTLNHNSCQN